MMIEFGSNIDFNTVYNEVLREDYDVSDPVGYKCPLASDKIVQLTPDAIQKVLYGANWQIDSSTGKRPWTDSEREGVVGALYPSKIWRASVVKTKFKNQIESFAKCVNEEISKRGFGDTASGSSAAERSSIEIFMSYLQFATDESEIDYSTDFLDDKCKIKRGMLSQRNAAYNFNAWPAEWMVTLLKRHGVNFKPKTPSNKGLMFTAEQSREDAGEAVATILHHYHFYSANSTIARRGEAKCLSPYSYEKLSYEATGAFLGNDIDELTTPYMEESIRELEAWGQERYEAEMPSVPAVEFDPSDFDASIDDRVADEI